MKSQEKIPNKFQSHLKKKASIPVQTDKKASKKSDLSDVEVSSLNECNFKNYEHENPDDTSIINGLSDIEVSKETKEKFIENLKEKLKETEKNCENLKGNLKELELKNKNVLKKKLLFSWIFYKKAYG